MSPDLFTPGVFRVFGFVVLRGALSHGAVDALRRIESHSIVAVCEQTLRSARQTSMDR